MGALSGRDLLLKIEIDAEFVTVAGLRTKSFQLNSRKIDITDAGSEGWRDLLPGAGLRSAELTGKGIFRNAASDQDVRRAFFAQDSLNCQFFMPGFGRLDGMFLITGLKYSGEYDGVATFDMTFESAGSITFEALP